jgi:flavin-dependent dehydrogenase
LEGGRYCDGSFHVIRDYSYRPTQLTGPGFFLIGDAAAFIDPIFSAGIPLAMYSAYLTTWAIDRSFRDPSRSAENQGVFARQFLQRLELSRSLALPRYRVGENASGLAQAAMRFESSLSQELMYVAATCTTRNENFLEMVQGKSGQMMSSHKFRTLEEIAF